MTLSLKRIELSNFRSHESTVFEPTDEGITSISGKNGAGKSTIVDAIAWTLYGVKPKGVKKHSAFIREGAVVGKDKTYATIEMNVGGREIKVERRLVNKGATTECEVFEKNSKDEWVTIAGPSVTHAEPEIRKLVKMDKNGFLAAVLVQQKQVDQLISADQKDRAAVIEKLTGIASISAALQDARAEHNTLKKTAAETDIDEDGLEKSKKELLKIENDISVRTEKLSKLTDKEQELRTLGIELKKEVDVGEASITASAEAKERIAALTATIEAQESELERVIKEKDAKKAKISALSSGSSLEEVVANRTELQNSADAISQRMFGIKNNLLNLNEKEERYQEVLEVSRVKDLETAQSGLDAQKEKLASTHKAVESQKNLVTSLASKVESITNAIAVIGGTQGECPTCLQSVADVDVAIDSLRNEIRALKESQEKALTNQEKAEQSIPHIEKNIEKFDLLIESISGVKTVREDIVASEKELSALNGEKVALDKEIKSLNKIVSELEVQEEMRQEYQEVLTRAQNISVQIDGHRKSILEAQGHLKATMTQKSLESKKTKLEDARNKYLEVSRKLGEDKGELNVQAERKKHLSEKISIQEKEITKHKELLKSVEIAGTTFSLIEEFRSDRINSSVPVIEQYASDLLSKFTEGKFTDLKIDSKYNVVVGLADGTTRPTGLLSGGELSAAAMSLRLAISMLLNGGASQSLIVLDEVLVSQDANRAELILNTIKEVCKGQVVLIAHNDSINDIADKIVQL